MIVVSGVSPGRDFTTWKRSGNTSTVAFGNRLYCCRFSSWSSVKFERSSPWSTPTARTMSASTLRKLPPSVTCGAGPASSTDGFPIRVPITAMKAAHTVCASTPPPRRGLGTP